MKLRTTNAPTSSTRMCMTVSEYAARRSGTPILIKKEEMNFPMYLTRTSTTIRRIIPLITMGPNSFPTLLRWST